MTSPSQDGVERELKIPVESLEPVRQRLQSLEAEIEQPSSLERNWVLDRDEELKSSQRLIRLREVAGRAELTFKGPPQFEGATKVREEIETEVANPQAVRKILERLGYRVVRCYEKRRAVYRFEDALVCLDETPLGCFVEVEGNGVSGVAKTLGLDPAEAEARTYLKLWEDHRTAHPETPRDMVFSGDDPRCP